MFLTPESRKMESPRKVVSSHSKRAPALDTFEDVTASFNSPSTSDCVDLTSSPSLHSSSSLPKTSKKDGEAQSSGPVKSSSCPINFQRVSLLTQQLEALKKGELFSEALPSPIRKQACTSLSPLWIPITKSCESPYQTPRSKAVPTPRKSRPCTVRRCNCAQIAKSKEGSKEHKHTHPLSTHSLQPKEFIHGATEEMIPCDESPRNLKCHHGHGSSSSIRHRQVQDFLEDEKLNSQSRSLKIPRSSKFFEDSSDDDNDQLAFVSQTEFSDDDNDTVLELPSKAMHTPRKKGKIKVKDETGDVDDNFCQFDVDL